MEWNRDGKKQQGMGTRNRNGELEWKRGTENRKKQQEMGTRNRNGELEWKRGTENGKKQQGMGTESGKQGEWKHGMGDGNRQGMGTGNKFLRQYQGGAYFDADSRSAVVSAALSAMFVASALIGERHLQIYKWSSVQPRPQALSGTL